MTTRVTNSLSFGLLLLSAIAAALSLIIMFKAGCAGNVKGGSYGDPTRALEFEGLAFLPLVGCAVFGGAGIICLSRLNNRVALGAALALLALVSLWLGGVYVEIWAVQRCFAQL